MIITTETPTPMVGVGFYLTGELRDGLSEAAWQLRTSMSKLATRWIKDGLADITDSDGQLPPDGVGKQIRTCLYVPAELHQVLAETARSRQVSMSALVRDWITDGIIDLNSEHPRGLADVKAALQAKKGGE